MGWPETKARTTAQELTRYIGREVLLDVSDMRIAVKVSDLRSVYGGYQFLVAPLRGEGQQWVSVARCTEYRPSNGDPVR